MRGCSTAVALPGLRMQVHGRRPTTSSLQQAAAAAAATTAATGGSAVVPPAAPAAPSAAPPAASSHRRLGDDAMLTVTSVISQLDVVRWVEANAEFLGMLGSATLRELGLAEKPVLCCDATMTGARARSLRQWPACHGSAAAGAAAVNSAASCTVLSCAFAARSTPLHLISPPLL